MGISIEETYLKYGVSSDLAEKYSSLGLPVSTFRALSSDKLVEFYGIQKGEIKLTKQFISRKPIEDDVLIRLLQNCNFVCCCCKKNESGFIIHHIEEYSNSQDNSYDNLIVLCPNHHDLAHRNNGLTMRLSAENLKQAKAEWENEVKKHNHDRASWGNDSSDLARAGQIFKGKIDFNILLLRFERLENDMGRKIEETICRRLLQMVEEENLNVSIFFNKEIEIPKTFEEGRSIGKKLNADLVIWGEVYDESRKGELMYSVTSSMDLPIAPNRRTGIQSISSMSEIKEGYLQEDIDLIIYWTLAIRALYQNNPTGIIEYALKALEYDELNLSCHYLLGQGLHFEEQFEQSIETFKLCIKLGADGADIYNNLGLSYLMANQLSEAAESLWKAYNKEPLSDIVLHNIGLLYAKQEDYDKAIDFLNKSMELNNGESSLWNSLGGIYYAQGEIEKAIEVYLKGLSINPDDYTILNGLGICYMQMKEYKIAEEYFNGAISKNYRPCVPYNNLGLLKREEGKLEEAIDYFMNAINESPFYIKTYVNLIDFTFEIKCYDLVLAFFDLSKKIGSLDFDSKCKVAISFSELGFENEALEMYNELLIEDEKDLLIHYDLGLIYLKNKKFKEAIECFKKVIELDGSDPGAFFNLASAYLEINELESANMTLNELWRLDNQSYDSLMIHGHYWEKRGDKAKSEEFYMHARQIEESMLLGEADDNGFTGQP